MCNSHTFVECFPKNNNTFSKNGILISSSKNPVININPVKGATIIDLTTICNDTLTSINTIPTTCLLFSFSINLVITKYFLNNNPTT